MIAYGLDIYRAAAAGLIPIAVFALTVGSGYLAAGDTSLAGAGIMLAGGFGGGAFGLWLTRRVTRRLALQIFAVFLAVLAVYMFLNR